MIKMLGLVAVQVPNEDPTDNLVRTTWHVEIPQGTAVIEEVRYDDSRPDEPWHFWFKMTGENRYDGQGVYTGITLFDAVAYVKRWSES